MTVAVSIICVTHNRRELVLRCLESCYAQAGVSFEAIVVVNGCTDGSSDAIAARFPAARRLETDRNIGFFPALNRGLKAARGAYVMTIDDDARFLTNGALARFVAALEQEPELAAVTCSIRGPRERPPESEARYVHTFKTGFTMLRAAVFREWVGFYPDLFFRSAGENFVCTALWDQGRRVKQLADILIHHDQAAQGRSNWDWTFYGLRSQILLVWIRDPWLLVCPRLGVKFLRSLAHCLRRGRLPAWAWAWLTVWIHVPTALRLRRPIRWSTQVLLWRLRRERVTRTDALPPAKVGTGGEGGAHV